MLSTKKFSKYFISDPIHGSIYIDHIAIHELICTQAFQRLKNIKQLGFNYFLYPSGTHSRFAHSLGVYWIAHQILELKQHDLSKNEQLLLLMAALLHDIGHGPFSHAFEHIFNKEKHEIKTIQILNSKEIKDVLDKYKKKYRYDFFENLVKIFHCNHTNQAIINLISSEVDIDRMDFLLRDAYFTGNPLGNFDLSFLLKGIIIEKNQLFFNKASITHLNSFLLARVNMYQSIYYHPKVIKFNFLFEEIIKRVKEIKSFNKYPATYNDNLFFSDDKFQKLEYYLELSDHDFFVDLKKLALLGDLKLKFLVETFFNWRSVKLIKFYSTLKKQNSELNGYNIIKLKITKNLKQKEEIYFLKEYSPAKDFKKLIAEENLNKIKIKETYYCYGDPWSVIKPFSKFCNIFLKYDENEFYYYYLIADKKLCDL